MNSNRNLDEATNRLANADQSELALIAKHDPDMIREVAAALRSRPSAAVVAWRWRPKGDVFQNWIYDPTPEWREEHKHEVDIEPLYASPSPERDTPREEGAAVEQEPVAWIVLSENQENVRIWWRRKDLAEEWAKTHSAPLIPLYSHPRCAHAILPLAPPSPPADAVREALDVIAPFISVADQSPSQMAKVIHKGIDGMTPIALTVTKEQFKRACEFVRTSRSALSPDAGVTGT